MISDDLRIGHAGHAAVLADVGRHALERHHGDRAGVLGDLRLLGIGDVHNDAALEHLGQADLGLARLISVFQSCRFTFFT